METALSPVASASAFRVLLDCMARPGRIGALAHARQAGALHDSTMSLVYTLIDPAAPVYISPDLASLAALDQIRFATGAVILPDPAAAAFVIASAAQAQTLLPILRMGTPEYPDRSATLIIQCGVISNTEGVTIAGPGIETSESLHAEGLAPAFFHALDLRNREAFPMGIDVFLTAPAQVAAIARSTRIGAA
jgi:alpha-D-ribose 1-methylphosphonate 5-triphosphate synthase subunit PhnH